MTKIYAKLSGLLNARENCLNSNNQEWFERHGDSIGEIMKNSPSGSGIDQGTKLDLKLSTSEKLVFATSFHHIGENGSYDGWTDHTITVRPSLQYGINIKISGRDRNEIKEYLHEVYNEWLKSETE